MTAEVKQKEASPVDQLKNSLKQMEPQFRLVLPKHVTSEKFLRTVFTAVQQNKDLIDADRATLFAACMKAASQGLAIDGKEAALVTFKNKQGVKQVQYMPMVAGILKLVRQSGELLSITSQIVHKNDKFKYWINGTGEHIEHEPNFFEDRGEPIGAYALATTKDGGVYLEILTTKQIMDIKKSSRSADYGPWSGLFEFEMWKKSCIRRLSKRLPSSTDVEAVIHADDDLYELRDTTPQIQQNEIKAIETTTPKKKSNIERIVDSKSVKPKELIQEVSNVTKQQTPAKEDEPRNEVGASELPL